MRRRAEARTALEAAFVRDSTNAQSGMLLSRAFAVTGEDSAAAEVWARTGARFHFGVEDQFDWQLASYERAKALERMGREELAIEEYRRLIGRNSGGTTAAEPPALVDARARLQRLERRGR